MNDSKRLGTAQRGFAESALALSIFHGWLGSLHELPDRLRVQGVVLGGVLGGIWFAWRSLNVAPWKPLIASLGLGLIAWAIECAVLRSLAAIDVVVFAAPVGFAVARMFIAVLRRWRAYCERSLVAALAHAQLSVLAVVFALTLVVFVVLRFEHNYMAETIAGLEAGARLAVRIVAIVMPIVVVVGGLGVVALLCLLPPALLLSWLAARGTARRVERLVAVESMANARRDLFARVAHELKNPLAALRAAVDALRERHRELPEIEVLDDGVARLGHVVGDLTDLARAELGVLAVERRDVVVADVIESVVKAHVSLADRQDVVLVVEVDAVRGVVCRLDRRRFEQVIANLLVNAFRHVDAGGIVRVAAERAGSRVRVVVEDTGGGIESSALSRIFEPGFSGDGGLGLGLALARELIERMGGTIRAESTPHDGARFVIEI